MKLRWEKSADGRTDIAYIGQLSFGAIGLLNPEVVEGNIRFWYNATHAVHIRGISRTHGHVTSRSTARKAVERAWQRWLEVSGFARQDAALQLARVLCRKMLQNTDAIDDAILVANGGKFEGQFKVDPWWDDLTALDAVLGEI